MRVDCALICDAVTVREGLLHILGGGITRIHRPAYPAAFGACLALRIMVHPSEASREHELTVTLVDEDGGQVAQVLAKFQAPAQLGGDLRPGEELALPVPLQLLPIGLPHEGPYSFDLLIDGVHQISLPFIADQQTPASPPTAHPKRGRK